MDAAAAAAEVARAAIRLVGFGVVFAGCAAPRADVGGPRILRRWEVAASSAVAGSAPVAAVVGSAAEWRLLCDRWQLPAEALPSGACDFGIARCLVLLAPGASQLAAAWGTEEGVDVLTLTEAGHGGVGKPLLHGFVVARRPAQLAVVYRPEVGSETVVWVDPGRN